MDCYFDPERHIRSVNSAPIVHLAAPNGSPLPGIMGSAGAAAQTSFGYEVGVDKIVMWPGSAFALHTHPGAHILYVLVGRGFVHVSDRDHDIGPGDTIYVPALLPHGVRTGAGANGPLEFLAFGVPHKGLQSTDRMALVGSN